MPDPDIQRILDQLVRRIQRLEQTLGLPQTTDDDTAPSALQRPVPSPPGRQRPDLPAARTEVPTQDEPVKPGPPMPAEPAASPPPSPPPPPPPPAPGTTRPALAHQLIDKRRARDDASPSAAHSTTQPPTAATPPARRPPSSTAAIAPPRSADRGDGGLEMLLGGKAAAWIGAIVIVIGAGFLVKLGFDAGWWGHLSELTRCLLIAAFGGALLLAGEVALRRISRPASVGLFGAGLGVLYLDAFATFRFFGLLGEAGSFLLMGVVALAGFAITLRARFRTIGILSLVGGYLTPILLRGAGGHDLELLTYLTALFGIALALSTIDPRHFRALRYLAIGGQAAIAFLWLVTQGSTLWMMAVVFMSIWWAMLLIETVIAALREQSPRGNPVAVLLGTAGYATATCWILNGAAPNGPEWLGAFTAAIAVLGAAVAFHFTGIEALRKRPREAIDKLAVSLWLQSGALLVIAAALQFDGFGQSVSWLVLGLAAVEIGRRLPSRGADGFAVAVLALGTGRVLLIDSWLGASLTSELWRWGDISINGWAVLAVMNVLFVHLAAQRLRPAMANAARPRASRFWQAMPFVLALLGALLWLIVCAAQTDGLTTTATWLIAPVALLALERLGRRQRHLQIAMLALVAIAARWLIVDAIGARLQTGWNPSAHLPVLNWQMAMAVATAGVGAWAMLLLRRRERARPGAAIGEDLRGLATNRGTQLIAIAGTLFVLIGLSFEVDRLVEAMALANRPIGWSLEHVRQLSLTILWSFGSVGLGVIARTLLRPADQGTGAGSLVLRFAWTLLSLCAFKWVIADTLYWTVIAERASALSLTQVLNVQMFAALVLAGGVAVLAAVTRPAVREGMENDDRRADLASMVRIAPAAISVLVLWAVSFEIDRAVARFGLEQFAPFAFHPMLLRALAWTSLWAMGGAIMAFIATRRKMPSLLISGWTIILGSALVWLTWGTLGWRITEGAADVPVVLNLQFAAGLVAAIAAGLAVRWMRSSGETAMSFRWLSSQSSNHTVLGAGLIALIGLWLGSFEIDRALAGDAMAVHAGLSVYWALYGVLLVVIGFAKRWATARYAGLALLAITVGKVLLVDLRTLDTIWRVISFLVSGLLLVGTSVLYTKLTPRLLRDRCHRL